MPAFQNLVSVAANSTIENVISGSQFEFAPYDAAVDFAIIAGATGVVADVTTGSDVVAEAMTVANRSPLSFPTLPDDFVASDVVARGERIKVRLRNTTAAAISVVVSMRILPVRT